MGVRGPAPEPEVDRERKGNPGKRSHPEQVTPSGRPAPRASLRAEVREEFERIVGLLDSLGVSLGESDAPALELLAGALEEHHRLQAWMAAPGGDGEVRGPTYETVTENGSVMYRKRPEAELASDAWKRAAAMLAKFGLTAVDRTRVPAKRGGGAADAGAGKRERFFGKSPARVIAG